MKANNEEESDGTGGGNDTKPKDKDSFWKNVGDLIADVSKASLQPIVSTANIFGAGVDVEYETEVGKYLGDLGMAAAEAPKNSVGSITGNDRDFDYQTKAGKNVGGVVEMGVDSGHVALKTFADGVSGGYATKVMNVVRADENKVQNGQYSELKEGSKFESSFGQKVDKYIMAGAPIVGTLGGAALSSKEGSEQSKLSKIGTTAVSVVGAIDAVVNSIEQTKGTKSETMGDYLQNSQAVADSLKPVKAGIDFGGNLFTFLGMAFLFMLIFAKKQP